MGDSDWHPRVAQPAYASQGPLVRVDEAHGGLQTIDGRYAGFAALLRADGYEVDAGRDPLDAPGALDGVTVLVISNPAGPTDGSDRESALTEAEIETVSHWVEQGGSLLLVADHAPHGTAAEALGARFGVTMGKGYAFVLTDNQPETNPIFEGRSLGDHPIIAGRSPSETVRRVQTFTGQSLSGPPGSTILLGLPETAREVADQPTLRQLRRRLEAGGPDALNDLARPALPSQGVAFTHGAGRVVVLGEAGMLTAQVIRFPPQEKSEPIRFGLNTDGHDDQQFALNVLHWLSGLIP